MTRQDKMKINNLLVRIKQIEDEIERLRLFDNQIEANYNRVFDYGVTNRIMLDEQCRKIGELKAKLNARLTCDFVKARQNYAMQDFAGKLKDKLFSVFGKTICSDLDTEDITDIIDQLLKEYE